MLRPDSLALKLSTSLYITKLLCNLSPKYWSCSHKFSDHPNNATRIQTRAAQGQLGGETDLQPLPKLTAPGMSKPKSDDSEEPAPLAFSTGAPESEPEPDDDGNGLVVDAGSYPAVELDDGDDDANTQLPELGLTVTSIAVPPKSQLEGTGFLW